MQLRLGFSDARQRPVRARRSRRAYDLLALGFGPGSNGPLFLVSDAAGRQPTLPSSTPITTAVKGTPGVAAAVARPADDGDTIVSWFVVPTTAPQDEATTNLVPPPARRRASVGHGGNRRQGARDRIGRRQHRLLRLPSAGGCRCFIGAVLWLSFLLLMVGVPLAARAPQGRHREPVVDRRRLRHRRRRVPVGLGRALDRRRAGRTDRARGRR